mmetsp:Transcript_22742/g.33585  ORF Transcript_22742/g.33585 Transcript_22742/m.33585 type:complete len:218 (+) Transcript_22742:141-794(+)|eukprot:CAMPEP_0194211112 /NCGR_PEP_ID=MMETSP0156-20130528/9469_1 /TAXON_ID=33649 /ORGANISM="Thalassionema nitzschioides, Strain L26-B" /LENGTH=217 /DNA_ID=CAMNT_0038938563 /DNA_START=89 /DNA_END=742 /DNA_ORIENTATION=+
MTLEKVATFCVKDTNTTIYIAIGTVMDFEASDPASAAIVNASNPTCIADFINGTSEIEQLIQQAGSEKLLAARLALPTSGENTRCEVGDAKIHGPFPQSRLPSHYVVDAAGPNYVEHDFDNYEEVDELLMSAYGMSLELCKEKGLGEVATGLISFSTKGKRSLKQILALSLSSLGYWAQENPETTLKSIYMCAPSKKIADKIVECGKKLGLVPEEEK